MNMCKTENQRWIHKLIHATIYEHSVGTDPNALMIVFLTQGHMLEKKNNTAENNF